MAVDGLGVAEATAGFVLLWSGYKNTSFKDTLQAFLHGKIPVQGPAQNLSIGISSDNSGSTSGTGSAGAGSGSGIAQDALAYQGHPYLFGGAPGPSGTQPWDCSSFVNWVLAHDMGMAIPLYAAGKWNPAAHGPATGDYLIWNGAKTVGSAASAAEPGDLCVWQTHMGIATGGNQMISALNEHLGTLVTSISGGAPAGELLSVRRIASVQAAPAPGGGGGAVTIQNSGAARLVAATYGWSTGAEWSALTQLIRSESGGNPGARNPSSGAYGIAQALGHGTSATAGTVTNEYGGYGVSDATAKAANSGNAVAQLTWMMAYIKQTYGDPVNAWAFHLTAGYY